MIRPSLGLIAFAVAISSGGFRSTPLGAAEVPRTPISLPLPSPAFKGKIGLIGRESTPDWPAPARARPGAPNILLILLDDIGFGATSTFGGVARTPEIDRLAAGALVYNRFHTTALCSPTRAALLTGRNHHQVGFGDVAEAATGYPSYNAMWNRATVSVAEVLRQNGYSTSAFGKWHNTPPWEVSPAGPFDRWPTGLGFEYFYGFQGGATSQYEPRLYRNTLAVEPAKTPAQGYHLTTDLVDDAIHWLNDHETVAVGKPYFLYFATGAVHSPHHVPEKWIRSYQGRFDTGWDRLRVDTFQRQKKLGVIPAGAELTPRPAPLPAWDTLTADQRKVLARQMEVYAGFVEHTDYEIGRLIERVRRGPDGDNTLILYIVGDNGGSAEGGYWGTEASRVAVYVGQTPQAAASVEHIAELGGPQHDNNFGVGWGWATTAPFQWMKQFASHFGGVRNPLLVSWPKGIASRGLRSQFHHVNDIAPTLYEVTGITFPDTVNGVAQLPIEGTSLVYSFADAAAPGRHRRQYFEMIGNRAIYEDGWVAAAHHGIPWQPETKTGQIAGDRWELYNIDEDFSEARDLAARHPAKLQELKALFDREAERNQIYPIYPRTTLGFATPLAPAAGRTFFTYYPGTSRLPPSVLPSYSGRSHRLTAEVEIPAGGAEGVIAAQGGRQGGFVLYVQGGQLVYENNVFAATFERIVAARPLPAGRHTIAFEFSSETGRPLSGGAGRLTVDGAVAGEGRLSRFGTSLGSGYESLDVGEDLGQPVSPAYVAPFRFTGGIEKVTLELR
ncbi:MAG: arylsulfatase [Opitutus sp.]|nr:arylsulfatase [Opitutus sp.]